MGRVDYRLDVVAFIRDLCPMEGDYGPRAVIPPSLEAWLYRAFPLPDGNPAARNVLDSRSKKQGKSANAAGVALYMATRQPYAEVVIAAADKDQAKDRVLRAAKFAVERGPLARHATVYRDMIEFDNNSTILALPFDWRGASGGNYACVVFDELHGYTLETQRRMFDELIIPPTKPNGVRWIASYAGFLGESLLLKEIWDQALAGQRDGGELPIYHNSAASLLALVDVGEASWRMPWTQGESGRRYIAEQQASERPNTFRRLWLNEWVENEAQFVTADQWAACYSPDVRPLLVGNRGRVTFGADASTSRDLTALVGCVYNASSQRVEVVYCRVWRPERGVLRMGRPTVDLAETIGAEVGRLRAAGHVGAIYADPYQLHTLIVEWEKAGIRAVEMPQTSARVEADQSLYDAIIGRRIAHCGDPALTEHIGNAVALETPRGLRLAKEKTTRPIDAAVALSMAHFGALQERSTAVTVTAPAIVHDLWSTFN